MADDNNLQVGFSGRVDSSLTSSSKAAKDAISTVGEAAQSQSSALQTAASGVGQYTQAVGTVQSSGGRAVATLGNVEQAMTRTGHSSAGLARELIVLAHEGVTGNFTRMGGSMMVLAERSGQLGNAVEALAPLFTPVGIAATALGVTLTIVGINAEIAARRMNELRDEMVGSGRGDIWDPTTIRGYTEQLERAGVGGKETGDVLQMLATRADLSADTMRNLTAVVAGYARITGQTAPQALAELLAAIQKPDQGLVKINEHTGLFNAATRKSIQTIHDLGGESEAAATIMEMLDQRIVATGNSMTWLQKQAQTIKEDWTATWDAILGTHAGAPATVGPVIQQPDALKSAMDSGKFGTDAQMSQAMDLQKESLKSQLDAMNTQMDAFKQGSAQRIAILQNELALIRSFEGEKSDLYRETEGKYNDAVRESATQETDTQQRILQSNQDTSKQIFDIKKKTIDDEAQLGEISQADQIAQLTALCNQEYALEMAALDDKVRLWKEGTAEYQEALNQQKVLTAQHAEELESIRLQAKNEESKDIKDTTKDWSTYAASIKSSVNSAFTSIINGTFNWRTAVTSTLSSLAKAMLDNTLKDVETAIAGDTQKTASNAAMETSKTAANLTGNALRTAADTGAAKAGSTAALQAGSISIMNDAKQAAAGAYASASQIPVVGWIAGPAAAAAAFTAVSAYDSLASFDVGSWNVPSDMVANIHQGEMILPKPFAQSLRENGGMGSGGTNITIQAIDSRDVARFLRQNGGALASSLANAARMGNRNINAPS